MKLNGKYRVRKVGGSYIVVRLGEGQDVNLSKLITLNETGAFIFNKIMEGLETEDIAAAILAEYDIDAEGARSAVVTYVDKLTELGIVERQ